MAAAVAPASASQARVDDSTSVSRNVTVPEGLRTTSGSLSDPGVNYIPQTADQGPAGFGRALELSLGGFLGYRRVRVNAKAVELILLRQLLSRLPLPATLVDASGNVVYLNPPAERLLGYTLEEFGEIPLSRAAEMLDPRHADDSPMELRHMPLSMALHDRRPQQYPMIIHDRSGVPHRIVTTAIPLDGQGGTLLGAMNFFWDEDEEQESVLS